MLAPGAAKAAHLTTPCDATRPTQCRPPPCRSNNALGVARTIALGAMRRRGARSPEVLPQLDRHRIACAAADAISRTRECARGLAMRARPAGSLCASCSSFYLPEHALRSEHSVLVCASAFRLCTRSRRIPCGRRQQREGAKGGSLLIELGVGLTSCAGRRYRMLSHRARCLLIAQLSRGSHCHAAGCSARFGHRGWHMRPVRPVRPVRTCTPTSARSLKKKRPQADASCGRSFASRRQTPRRPCEFA